MSGGQPDWVRFCVHFEDPQFGGQPRIRSFATLDEAETFYGEKRSFRLDKVETTVLERTALTNQGRLIEQKNGPKGVAAATPRSGSGRA